MALQNIQNQDMGLVLSTDAKPRLKWTPELHQRFVEAVNQLGGAEKATPKSLMRMMGIPGLTLYHLKSHLQKYRLGKNQHSETHNDSKQQHSSDHKENLNELELFKEGNETDDSTQDQINENVRIAQAIQMQMEVQRKLHEQIEVQRHLQMRIEAQGKYLQKVLRKAQETLSTYSCSSSGVEHAKAELSQLVSMVSNSSFSELTEATDLSPENPGRKPTLRGAVCSVESSLTSSESSGRREEDREINPPLTLPLLDQGWKGKKRSRSTNSGGGCVEQTASKKRSTQGCKEETGHGLRELGLLETFDLNSQCEQSELDLGPKKQPIIDLNSKGIEQFNHHL